MDLYFDSLIHSFFTWKITPPPPPICIIRREHLIVVFDFIPQQKKKRTSLLHTLAQKKTILRNYTRKTVQLISVPPIKADQSLYSKVMSLENSSQFVYQHSRSNSSTVQTLYTVFFFKSCPKSLGFVYNFDPLSKNGYTHSFLIHIRVYLYPDLYKCTSVYVPFSNLVLYCKREGRAVHGWKTLLYVRPPCTPRSAFNKT